MINRCVRWIIQAGMVHLIIVCAIYVDYSFFASSFSYISVPWPSYYGTYIIDAPEVIVCRRSNHGNHANYSVWDVLTTIVSLLFCCKRPFRKVRTRSIMIAIQLPLWSYDDGSSSNNRQDVISHLVNCKIMSVVIDSIIRSDAVHSCEHFAVWSRGDSDIIHAVCHTTVISLWDDITWLER